MPTSLRQHWDSVNDCPLLRKPDLAKEERRRRQAEARPIPEYWAKVVRLPHGQTEVSVTPANRKTIINLRMGFNPLLDSPRKRRTTEEQEERDKENRERASKRARQNVRYLVKTIFADHMLTFAYRENVIDRARVAAEWKEYVRLFRIRYPNWQYLAVLEKQERGAYHIHVAVTGKQDIRWALRCWLLAIGQPAEEVNAWYIHGIKLGEKSLGSVNVEPPKRRWGGTAKHWQRNKLAGYLTKYIGKEFEDGDKGAKKYWHSRNAIKPVVEKYWLRAETFAQAVAEAHDIVYYTGATSLSMWGDFDSGCIWITGETAREMIGRCSSQRAELLDD
jgi:hypothetical protein